MTWEEAKYSIQIAAEERYGARVRDAMRMALGQEAAAAASLGKAVDGTR